MKLLTLKEAIDQRIPNCVIRKAAKGGFEFEVGKDLGFSISGVHLHSDFWDSKEWVIVTKEEIQKERDDYKEPTTKVYKLEVMVIDHEMIGEEEIISLIESSRQISPDVIKAEMRDIGVWNDDHPLNKIGSEEEYERLFHQDKL